MTNNTFSDPTKTLLKINAELDEIAKTQAFGYYMTAKLEAAACDWLRYQRDQPPVPTVVRDAIEQQFGICWQCCFNSGRLHEQQAQGARIAQ